MRAPSTNTPKNRMRGRRTHQPKLSPPPKRHVCSRKHVTRLMDRSVEVPVILQSSYAPPGLAVAKRTTPGRRWPRATTGTQAEPVALRLPGACRPKANTWRGS